MKKWKIGLFAGLMMLVNTFSSVAQADVGVTQGKKMTPFTVMSLDEKVLNSAIKDIRWLLTFGRLGVHPAKLKCQN